eukprot:3411171-Amphidinium_carterae.1
MLSVCYRGSFLAPCPASSDTPSVLVSTADARASRHQSPPHDARFQHVLLPAAAHSDARDLCRRP